MRDPMAYQVSGADILAKANALAEAGDLEGLKALQQRCSAIVSDQSGAFGFRSKERARQISAHCAGLL